MSNSVDHARRNLTEAMNAQAAGAPYVVNYDDIRSLLTAYESQEAVGRVWREEALEFSHKLADRNAAYATLEEKFEKMRHAGSLLSNAAFNLSQPSVTLTDDARRSLKESQLAWDAALSGSENTTP